MKLMMCFREKKFLDCLLASFFTLFLNHGTSRASNDSLIHFVADDSLVSAVKSFWVEEQAKKTGGLVLKSEGLVEKTKQKLDVQLYQDRRLGMLLFTFYYTDVRNDRCSADAKLRIKHPGLYRAIQVAERRAFRALIGYLKGNCAFSVEEIAVLTDPCRKYRFIGKNELISYRSLELAHRNEDFDLNLVYHRQLEREALDERVWVYHSEADLMNGLNIPVEHFDKETPLVVQKMNYALLFPSLRMALKTANQVPLERILWDNPFVPFSAAEVAYIVNRRDTLDHYKLNFAKKGETHYVAPSAEAGGFLEWPVPTAGPSGTFADLMTERSRGERIPGYPRWSTTGMRDNMGDGLFLPPHDQ